MKRSSALVSALVSVALLLAAPASVSSSSSGEVRLEAGPAVAYALLPECNAANDGLLLYQQGSGWWECGYIPGVGWRWRFVSGDPIFVIDGRAFRVSANITEQNLASVREVVYDIYVTQDASVEVVPLASAFPERFVIHRTDAAAGDFEFGVTIDASSMFATDVDGVTHLARVSKSGPSNHSIKIKLKP